MLRLLIVLLPSSRLTVKKMRKKKAANRARRRAGTVLWSNRLAFALHPVGRQTRMASGCSRRRLAGGRVSHLGLAHRASQDLPTEQSLLPLLLHLVKLMVAV